MVPILKHETKELKHYNVQPKQRIIIQFNVLVLVYIGRFNLVFCYVVIVFDSNIPSFEFTTTFLLKFTYFFLIFY